MLSKKNRITKKNDFERIFKKGVGFKENFLILKTASNSSQMKTSRFTFIVSRKISKKATIRNKIKRQLRELVRPQMDKIKKGIDGVFIVLPGFGSKSFQEMKDTVNNLLKKAKLI